MDEEALFRHMVVAKYKHLPQNVKKKVAAAKFLLPSSVSSTDSVNQLHENDFEKLCSYKDGTRGYMLVDRALLAKGNQELPVLRMI